jgi:hypothetical protein
MREANSTVARRPLLPLTLLPFVALLLAMSLGGCVAYSADYTDRPRPYYSSDYNSSFNTYENSGGGGH